MKKLQSTFVALHGACADRPASAWQKSGVEPPRTALPSLRKVLR